MHSVFPSHFPLSRTLSLPISRRGSSRESSLNMCSVRRFPAFISCWPTFRGYGSSRERSARIAAESLLLLNIVRVNNSLVFCVVGKLSQFNSICPEFAVPPQQPPESDQIDYPVWLWIFKRVHLPQSETDWINFLELWTTVKNSGINRQTFKVRRPPKSDTRRT